MFGKAVITEIATGGFCKKGVLRKSAQSTGNHLCQSLFFIKLQASACNFPKKETLTLVFSCKFCKISKKIFFTEHLRPTASERFIRRHNYKILHVYFILPKLLQYLWKENYNIKASFAISYEWCFRKKLRSFTRHKNTPHSMFFCKMFLCSSICNVFGCGRIQGDAMADC